jgi:septum formation protein
LSVLHNIKGKQVILASKSPRRHHLLKGIGIDFSIRENNDVEESYPDSLSAEEIPVYLAKKKASFYTGEMTSDTLLITADTIVWCDGSVLNKPKDKKDAQEILTRLSGNKHTVITGVCIRSTEKEVAFFAETDVYFAHLSDEEIEHYLMEFKPYDKAGAYGIQEWIGYIGIEKIDGSYFNVMGLPIQKLYTELKNF